VQLEPRGRDATDKTKIKQLDHRRIRYTFLNPFLFFYPQKSRGVKKRIEFVFFLSFKFKRFDLMGCEASNPMTTVRISRELGKMSLSFLRSIDLTPLML
jgi:hypothetical protein